MELNFALEYDLENPSGTEIQGASPDLLHFDNNEMSALYIKGGKLHASTTKTDEVSYNEPFDLETEALKNTGIEFFKLNNLSSFGAVGAIKCDGEINYEHRLLIYEYKNDISDNLTSGTTTDNINNPISSFSLNLANTEKKGKYLLAERESKSLNLNPGSKVILSFKIGDSNRVKIGEFFIDRGGTAIHSTDVKLQGRNTIGKALKDQTFDENYHLSYDLISEIIKKIIIDFGKIDKDKVFVETTSESASYTFEPEMTLLSGINEIFKTLDNWKIEESDGKIIVGSNNFGSFNAKETFYFERDKDAFSRKITKDDSESYRRVCVKDKDKTFEIYKEVEGYEGWNLKSNRTLHIKMPDNISSTIADRYATNVANLLSRVGKIEVFEIKFNPFIETGDTALIKGDVTDENYQKELGLITSVKHSFGKRGLSTTITVDSGGNKTQGRLADYIKQISSEKAWSRYSDQAQSG